MKWGWPSRALALRLLTLAVLLLAVGGALRLVQARERSRAAARRVYLEHLDWHARLAAELSPADRDAWQQAAAQAPAALLRVTAVELPAD